MHTTYCTENRCKDCIATISKMFHVKDTLASEFAQCQVSGQMSGKMRYSLQTWPRRAARAGGPPRVPGGPAGGQDRGCDPNHRLRHPPRWCGSGATPRNAPTCRSVPPLWGCTCRLRGENPPISARGTGSWSFRSDGARVGHTSLRRSTPTPPGGVTQPVVGVAPAVLAPRRPPRDPRRTPRAGGPAGPRL